jgi:hydroxymethylglutaryl-CoA lyase
MGARECRKEGGLSLLGDSLASKVAVYEVGPRDGLQNEAARLSVENKLELITALLDAGVRRLEATSFVSPRWIPQLSDADELVARLPRRAGVTYSALVPNERGLRRAQEVGLREVAVFLSSSETHNRKNINKSVKESLAGYAKILSAARAANIQVRGYVSTVWGCPYEGEVPIQKSVSIARRLFEMGCYQISLGDTIGVGTPLQTRRILEAMLARLPADSLAMHMHDTRGSALANVLMGLSLGIGTFDAAVGGMGGCPYAPGAAGNLSTEDLVYMLHGMGARTGIDLPLLVDAGLLAERMVERELPSKVLKAALGERQRTLKFPLSS